MKILVVGGHAPALIRFRGPLLKALVDKGHEVIAVADAAPPELVRQIEALGVRFRPIPVERNVVTAGGDLRLIAALTRLMREEAPDLFFGYMHKPIIYGTLAAVRAGVKRRVSMITGLGFPWEENKPKNLMVRAIISCLYKLAFWYSDAVIFHNSDDRDVMLRGRLLKSSQAHVVNGSGVSLADYPQQVVPRGVIRFVLVARLLKFKGIFEYAEAAKIVKKQFPEAEFGLVGGMDHAHPLAIGQADVAAWEQEGIVRYHGETSDVRPYLRDCSVYVLPSWAEGTPRSVLEAMATGRAVITTDTRGCRETVEHGVNGLLVPVRDSFALAQAMLELAGDPQRVVSMGEKSRGIAEKKYEVSAVNTAMMSIMRA